MSWDRVGWIGLDWVGERVKRMGRLKSSWHFERIESCKRINLCGNRDCRINKSINHNVHFCISREGRKGQRDKGVWGGGRAGRGGTEVWVRAEDT